VKPQPLIINGQKKGTVLIADSFGTRLRGMMFRNPLPEAMIIAPTSSVHGVGMTKSLDVAMIDDAGTVLKIARLRPFGLVGQRGATAALEAPVGSFEKWGLRKGMVIDTSQFRDR